MEVLKTSGRQKFRLNKGLQYMCFPKNFADALRATILENNDRLLLTKYLLKITITALDKFSEAAASRYLSK